MTLFIWMSICSVVSPTFNIQSPLKIEFRKTRKWSNLQVRIFVNSIINHRSKTRIPVHYCNGYYSSAFFWIQGYDLLFSYSKYWLFVYKHRAFFDCRFFLEEHSNLVISKHHSYTKSPFHFGPLYTMMHFIFWIVTNGLRGKFGIFFRRCNNWRIRLEEKYSRANDTNKGLFGLNFTRFLVRSEFISIT